MEKSYGRIILNWKFRFSISIEIMWFAITQSRLLVATWRKDSYPILKLAFPNFKQKYMVTPVYIILPLINTMHFVPPLLLTSLHSPR